ECRVDEQPFAPCASPYELPQLADGLRRFEVRAVDPGGIADPTPAAREFTVDTTPPETAIDAGPSGVVTTTAGSFAYSGPPAEDTAGFECALDGEGFHPCSTGGSDFSHLAEGEHSFAVRAADALGNADQSPATRSWTIDFAGDLRAPETSVTAGPSGITAAT